MQTQEILNLLEEALEVDAGSLELATEISSVDQWDSIGWLAVMSAVDERFDIRLDTQKISAFIRVENLVEHIEERLRQKP